MSKGSVVIIGSGLGGLACGVILAREGYSVTLLEQGAQAGGSLQCFKRNGTTFETGMHFVGSCDENQILYMLLRFLEAEGVELSELDPECYSVVKLADERFSLPKGRDAIIERLGSRFPSQRGNLKEYFDLIEKVAQSSSMHSLSLTDGSYMAEYQLRSVNSVLEETITDPLLAKVLAGTLPLYAGERDKTPFSLHAFITDFYTRSSFRFVGGSRKLTERLVEVLHKYGSVLHTGHKVTKILTSGERATEVLTENGGSFPCDYVISGAHPSITLELLGECRLIRPSFRERINSIPQTIGGFSLFLKFKQGVQPYMNHNFFSYREDTPWGCGDYTPQEWPKGYLYMHFCHEPFAKFARSGVLLSYMRYEELLRWSDTTPMKRGAEYEEFKRERAERLLDALEHDFPGTRERVESYCTATPLTYRDYTGAVKGGMYGVVKDVEKTAAYRVQHKTKIPNLFLTGQNINSHGMLGVLVGALVTCGEFVPTPLLFKQIKEGGR